MTSLSPPVSPPQHHAERPERPRAVSSMSHASTSSRRSRSSNKLDLTESARDKRRLNSESKADPSLALSEATPAQVALEHSSLDDIRTMQHKDPEGNVITDPDRSNPTRHRMERPLDTIRAFNAAAEGTSSRRSSSYGGRPTSSYGLDNAQSRRSSYYSNAGFAPRGRTTPGGYYRNSAYGFPQSSFGDVPEESQYYPPTRTPLRNMNSHYGYNNYANGESPMSAHSHQQSYETMTSGSDENSKSTNPSSLNSSYDQIHQTYQPRKPEQPIYENPYADEMNFAPVSPVSPQMPQFMNSGHGYSNGQGQAYAQDYQNGGYAPPTKQYIPNTPRQPIKLNAPSPVQSHQSPPTKRQSWIKRTFSRRQR